MALVELELEIHTHEPISGGVLDSTVDYIIGMLGTINNTENLVYTQCLFFGFLNLRTHFLQGCGPQKYHYCNSISTTLKTIHSMKLQQ